MTFVAQLAARLSKSRFRPAAPLMVGKPRFGPSGAHLATFLVATALSISALSGCRTNKDAAVPLVRVHAEKDLRCPSDQVHVRSQIGGRYMATGCGRSAVYNTACQALECAVFKEGEDAPGWRDRPDPDGTGFSR